MKTIIQTIDLLKSQDWDNISGDIDIAKGKNEIPSTFRDVKRNFKRSYRALKRKHFNK